MYVLVNGVVMTTFDATLYAMRAILIMGLITGLILASCTPKKEQLKPEPWITLQVSMWPDMVFENQVRFKDTLFAPLGNGFLLDSGVDTLGITCKHVFLAFDRVLGIDRIHLGDETVHWTFGNPSNIQSEIALGKLINSDSLEVVVPFREIKIKDWLVFELKQKDMPAFPLKLRTRPVLPNEVLYSVGWAFDQEDKSVPQLTKMQCYENMGDYFYVRTLTRNVNPKGKSGSPVIDANGYLVGLISGAEGKLGVIASVKSLQREFQKHGLSFEER
jgi:hypothetical protein